MFDLGLTWNTFWLVALLQQISSGLVLRYTTCSVRPFILITQAMPIQSPVYLGELITKE